MGCTQSKIENEEAVSRCKDRKQFMKEAVSARNAFAAAHSACAMSLKNTGAALSDYAHGEVQNPQFSATNNQSPAALPPASQAPFDILPPPPLPFESTTAPVPLHRASSMPEMKVSSKPESAPVRPPRIEEEEDDEMEIEDSRESLVRKRSSRTSGSVGGRIENHREVEEVQAPQQHMPQPTQDHTQHHESTWDYFFFPSVDSIPRPSLAGEEMPEEVKVNKDEIERSVFDEKPKKVEEHVPVVAEKAEMNKAVEIPVVEDTAVGGKVGKKAKGAGAGAGTGAGAGAGAVALDKRSGKVGNVNLLQIFVELDDHFLKASESAHEVSKMLEATRLHYHSNFADNRGHIDHSARVMRVITWNRSFRGFSNDDDGKDDFDSEEHETHATVLDKMLAWEKKLYDEVKAGEIMKFEYQKKVALLNKQKKRGTNSESLEKTKAAVSHLHTRYIVDMQSMDSTVSEINRLRDEQLYPKLVQLVDGMATMWEIMRSHHDSQCKIVKALRSLDTSQSTEETSEHHHERTIQLWVAVQEWHTQFGKLIDHQKGYIKALNNWLRPNLISIESSLKEKVSSPPRVEQPPIQALLHAWHERLDKLPDEGARAAISNFTAVTLAILQHQEDEMKLKGKCGETRKELNRKKRQFEDWRNKYTQQRKPDELDPERLEDNTRNDAVAERQFAVDTVEKRLEEEEEAYRKLCLQVREKSLTTLKTRLPDLFMHMTDFSYSCSEMYRYLRTLK